MKHFIIKVVILLIIVLGGFSITPLYSQSFNVLSGDTVKSKTDLKGQYLYSFVYLTMNDTVAADQVDSLQVFAYHPIQKSWIPARMINLTDNVDIAPSTSILITTATPKILAFYELYIYGWKIVKTNTVRNDGNTLIFNKNVGGL